MKAYPHLLAELMALLQDYRTAFSQKRVFFRALALFFSEIFAFGRHTITQALLALGLTDADWTAWYRLFSHGRVVAEKTAAILLSQTIDHVPENQPYVVGVDGVGVPRTGRKIPGAAWLPALFTAPFQKGLQRIQRFVDLAWLTPMENGYSRAIPLLWLPAFTQKAFLRSAEAKKEWEESDGSGLSLMPRAERTSWSLSLLTALWKELWSSGEVSRIGWWSWAERPAIGAFTIFRTLKGKREDAQGSMGNGLPTRANGHENRRDGARPLFRFVGWR